jgi:hypothetical protein
MKELKTLGITIIVGPARENPDKISWERQQSQNPWACASSASPSDGWAPPSNDQIAQFPGVVSGPFQGKSFCPLSLRG